MNLLAFHCFYCRSCGKRRAEGAVGQAFSLRGAFSPAKGPAEAAVPGLPPRDVLLSPLAL
jgi:hypothetical protein